MMIKSWSAILQNTGLSADIVRAAYRRMALEVHPDRGGSHERMVQVNLAWQAAEKYLERKKRR